MRILTLALVVALTSTMACGGGSGATPAPTDGSGSSQRTALPTVREVAPELAVLGDLAQVLARPVSDVFGPEGGSLEVGDGVLLKIPAGALSEATEISVAVVGLALNYVRIEAGDSRAYVIDAARDVPALTPPVVLELAHPAAGVVAAELIDGEWRRLEHRAGPPASIAITHFSRTIVTVVTASLEWAAEAVEEDEESEQAHRRFVDGSAAKSTRDFYGIDDPDSAFLASQADLCLEIRSVLEARDAPTAYQLPDDFNYAQLSAFLFKAGSPNSAEAGQYWNRVDAAVKQIRRVVLTRDVGAEGLMSPAEVLETAIAATGGNVPLGVLAAHNYLKEIAYEGRYYGDPKPGAAPQDVPPIWGEQASRLQPWRRESLSNPDGRYDKLGPLYHIFAAAALGVFGPAVGADAGVAIEALLRAVGGLGGIMTDDTPDREKGLADECGAAFADAFWEHKTRAEAASISARFTQAPATVETGERASYRVAVVGGQSPYHVSFTLAPPAGRHQNAVVAADASGAAEATFQFDSPGTHRIAVTVTDSRRYRVTLTLSVEAAEAAACGGLANDPFPWRFAGPGSQDEAYRKEGQPAVEIHERADFEVVLRDDCSARVTIVRYWTTAQACDGPISVVEHGIPLKIFYDGIHGYDPERAVRFITVKRATISQENGPERPSAPEGWVMDGSYTESSASGSMTLTDLGPFVSCSTSMAGVSYTVPLQAYSFADIPRVE